MLKTFRPYQDLPSVSHYLPLPSADELIYLVQLKQSSCKGFQQSSDHVQSGYIVFIRYLVSGIRTQTQTVISSVTISDVLSLVLMTLSSGRTRRE